MRIIRPTDRRRFLRLAAGTLGGILTTGCSSGDADVAALLASIPDAGGATTTPGAAGGHPLNLPLALAYVGAAFYGFAARGYGLPPALVTGVGRAGPVTGARRATFADDAVAACAAELADDKQRHVVLLRERIGARAAAQPALDLSTLPTGAFSIAAQTAGVVVPGGSFDPYAGDEPFLLAAFVIENAVAATYRTLLTAADGGGGDGDGDAADIVAGMLGDAIYHDGLIRTLLDDRAVANPAIAAAVAGAGTLLARLDGSDVGDQTLAGATGGSSNILDAAGRPIPFTRRPAQVLRSLSLTGTASRGFMPAGVNGIAA